MLAGVMLVKAVPDFIRSEKVPEVWAHALEQWLEAVGAKALFIKPSSLWEKGYRESFNGKPRDELLDEEIFYSMSQAQVLPE